VRDGTSNRLSEHATVNVPHLIEKTSAPPSPLPIPYPIWWNCTKADGGADFFSESTFQVAMQERCAMQIRGRNCLSAPARR